MNMNQKKATIIRADYGERFKTKTTPEGKVESRHFDYEESDLPTITSYMFGAILICRPVQVITKTGRMSKSFEIASMPIADNKILVDIITTMDDADIKPYLNKIISHQEFDELEDKFVNKKPCLFLMKR